MTNVSHNYILVSSKIKMTQNRRSPNAGLMMGQRRRRWANINPALGKRLVFAGMAGLC